MFLHKLAPTHTLTICSTLAAMYSTYQQAESLTDNKNNAAVCRHKKRPWVLGSEESDGTTSGKRIGYQQNPSNKSFPPYLLLDKLPINCCRISAINSRGMANKGVISYNLHLTFWQNGSISPTVVVENGSNTMTIISVTAMQCSDFVLKHREVSGKGVPKKSLIIQDLPGISPIGVFILQVGNVGTF